MPITLTTSLYSDFESTTNSNTPSHVTPTQTFDLTLDAAYDWGNYADGPAFIVVGNETPNITSRTPSATTLETKAANGAMLNPAFNAPQAYDERAAAEFFTSYGTPTGLPVAVSSQDIFVVCKSSTDTVAGSERDGVPEQFGAFFFVSEVPLKGSLSPYAVSESGRTAAQPYHINFDAKVAALPVYDTSGFSSLPTFTSIYDKLNKFFPTLAGDLDAVNPLHYRTMMPRNFGSPDNSGKYLVPTINDACLMLLSSSYTVAEKKQLAIALCSMGLQNCEPFRAAGQRIDDEGQHMQWHYTPYALALNWLDRDADIGTYFNLSGNFNQAFKMSAAQASDCVAHSDYSKPFTYRRRNINAISGNQMTLATYRSGTSGDSPKMSCVGMTVTDGTNSATVTAVSSLDVPNNTTGSLTFTVSSATGFAVDTDVWFIPPFTPTEGDYDWMLEGGVFNYYTPDKSAVYRNENKWAGQALLLKAIGANPTALEAMLGYVSRTNQVDDPVGYDYTAHNQTAFEVEFWNAHAATIFA